MVFIQYNCESAKGMYLSLLLKSQVWINSNSLDNKGSWRIFIVQ